MRIEALKINAETLPDYLSKTTAQAVKEHNADVDLLCQDARELEGRREGLLSGTAPEKTHYLSQAYELRGVAWDLLCRVVEAYGAIPQLDAAREDDRKAAIESEYKKMQTIQAKIKKTLKAAEMPCNADALSRVAHSDPKFAMADARYRQLNDPAANSSFVAPKREAVKIEAQKAMAAAIRNAVPGLEVFGAEGAQED